MIAAALAAAGTKFDCCGKAVCERQAAFPQWVLPDGTESMICPSQLVTRQSLELMKLYKHYRNGVLPVSGGLLDQSGIFVDAMEIIEQVINSEQSKSKL